MRPASRLSLAFADGHVALPEVGRVAVFGATAGADLSALPQERVHCLTRMKPDRDALAARGWLCNLRPEGRYSLSIVLLPRAKAQARARLAWAAAVTDGPVIVDGDKTDGIESVLKDLRKRGVVSAPLSKAHGKLFSFDPAAFDLSDWAEGAPQEIEEGFVTLPGVFSADGIDPASRALAEALPEDLGKHVIDLGAGWGYLSARALERESIERIELVEADHAALDCARINVPDARAVMHWDDALRFRPERRADTVIMNPPFHQGRKGAPELGQGFIATAAACLKPDGTLYMVANRHLPYEGVLAQSFAHVEEFGGDGRFKLLAASRPTRKRR